VHIAEVELARRERASRRTPVTFDFGGQTFTLLPVVPIGLGFDLMDAPEPEDNEAGAARAIARFVREALIEEDQPRFDEVLRNRSDPIDPEAIIDLGARVAEVYAGFPIEPSVGSVDGRRNGGRNTRPAGRGKAT
jgi:hypothetical protein